MSWEPVTTADLKLGDVVKREKNGWIIGMVTLVEDCTVGPRARPTPGKRVWFADYREVESLEAKVDARWYRRVT